MREVLFRFVRMPTISTVTQGGAQRSEQYLEARTDGGARADARQPAQDAWKADVLAGRIVLEDLDTQAYDLYSHQNEDIVRLTPQQLKAMMEAKERAAVAGE